MTKAARDAGAEVSITVRMDKKVKAAIGTMSDGAWTGIEYPEAIYDEDASAWISKAEVAEVPFTAFTSKKKSLHAAGRLVVRRIPELNETKRTAGQDPLFDLYRYHAFSPNRAWISPGSMVRSMWSLATNDPNTLVIPRSSSFTASGTPHKFENCRAENSRPCSLTCSLISASSRNPRSENRR